MANGRAYFPNTPAFTPLSFGLLAAATDATATAPDHWEAGITWQSHCPGADSTYDTCLSVTRDYIEPTETDVPDTPPDKVVTSDFLLRGATPFAVYAKFDCSPQGFWERGNELATQALTRVEGFEVERIFDTGIAPRTGGAPETAYPHLRADAELVDDTGAMLQSTADVITTNPLDAVEAFERIEAELADCYHGQGILHVPAVLSGQIAHSNLATARGGVLSTLSGNRVSLGSGYTGAAPDGTVTAGVAWVYATGAAFYFRSDVVVHDPVSSFDRSVNTVEALAERRYLFGWDCCHLAIPVQIGGIPGGEFDGAGPAT